MNELLMNDTFENFNFSQSAHVLTKIPLNSPVQAKLIRSSSNVQTQITDISFDDSIFLSQVSFLENKNAKNNEKEISKNDDTSPKSQNNAEERGEKNGGMKNEEYSEFKEKVIVNKSVKNSEQMNKTNENVNESSCNTTMINKLSSWGLPENILRKYESKKLTSMFSWQVDCLSQSEVLSGKNLVYSAPTSAGKTLVAEIIAIKTMLELKKKVIFILPFVSIVREKVYYFQNLLESSGIRVDGFMGSYNPPGGYGAVQFAICTIEKANSLINRLLEEGRLSEIGTVLIDEMHMLGDSSRGYLLELLLTKLRYISKKDNISIQIIGMSATLPNLNEISKWLDAALYTTDFRPVPLNEQAQVCGEIFDKNLKMIRKLNLLPGLSTDSDNILQLCLETIKESCSVLIFCPTKNWCENLAQQISTGFFKIGSSTGDWAELIRSQLDTNLIIELLEQLKYCPVGLDEVLRKTASFGVAYHHAGLTMDERDIIEGAFRNGALRVLVATSTLSSGVNLPARRVIIRTPIFHGKPLDSLIYRQMIGRAGRMGKDTVGESFLICQKSDFRFAKDLMSAKLTSVKSCLETAGKLKRAILEVIASGVASTPQDVQLFTESTLLASEDGNNAQELKNPINEAVDFLQINEFIRLQKQKDGSDKYVPTSLGKACLSSSIAPDEGLSLFTELEKARECLVLETELHLIYLVTPYSACYSWENIDWMFYLDLWEKLPKKMKKVGELIGIREVYIINATRKKIQTDTGKAFHKYLIHKRFFVALALQDLVNEKPLSWVCQKFNCNRGMLQSLQQSASSFAGMVTAFSKQLGWTSMELLLSQFQDRMQFGVSRDLLDLMHLPILNGKMARSLYNAGIETVIQLANSEISAIENILHRVVPFESEKGREGESEFQKKQRNKFRNVWITGRDGLTEREAAEIFVTEARKYLKIEMGLIDAKWKDADEIDGETSKTEVSEGEEYCNEDKENSRDVEKAKEITENDKVSKDNTYKDDKILQTPGENDKQPTMPNNIFEKPQMDEKMNQITHFSDDSSNDINISDTSSISMTDSTKIEEDTEEYNFIKETSNNLSEKLEKVTLNTPKKVSTIQNYGSDHKKNVSSLLKEITLSDFSDTLSETSSMNAATSSNPSIINDVELDKTQSDQSLFEESFTLQLSEDNKSSKEESEDERLNSFLQKAFNESFQPDKDIFVQSVEEEEQEEEEEEEPQSCLVKKRKYDEGFEESALHKKFKIKEDQNTSKNEDTNSTYILNKLEDHSKLDFSKMEVVNVCQELTLLEAFIKELKGLNDFSFSVACSKFTEIKPVIGMNIIKPQCSDGPEEKENAFTCDGRKVEGFSFCWENNTVYYLNLENVKLQQKILKLLKTVFKNPDTKVRMFDSKEQIKVLKNCCGINFCCKIDDPKIAEWILDAEGKEKNLKAMVVNYCPEGIKLSQLSGGCKGVGSVGLDIYSNVEAKIRSSLEAVLTWHLTDILKRLLAEESPKYLDAYDSENNIIVILAKLELHGFGINKNALKSLLDTLKMQISLVEKKAYSLAGRNFNFTSSADVAKVTGMYRGKKISTRKQILEKNQHPISDLVLQWRKLHSMLTKTIYPLIQAAEEDERIHGCYITHTATGRISMHEPNLQNINKDFNVSISCKENVSISCREVFQAREDHVLVSADYCQLELRILTHFSRDKSLCKIMREPGDVFRMVAAEWNNIKEEEVTDSIRQNAKHLCYGIIYGMGSKTLAEQLNTEETDAVEFMETFRNTYPGIKNFIKKTIENCRNCGYVETINGRKRFLPHINESDQIRKGQAERQAVNTIIQGSAADIVKGAMVTVEKELEEIFCKTKTKPKMVLYLHDELIYEVPNKYLRKVAKIIKKNMENSADISVPLPVKLKSGKSWGSMSEFLL